MGLSSILQAPKTSSHSHVSTSAFSAGKLLSVPKKGPAPIRKTIQKGQTIQIPFSLQISGSVLNRIIQRLNILLLALSCFVLLQGRDRVKWHHETEPKSKKSPKLSLASLSIARYTGSEAEVKPPGRTSYHHLPSHNTWDQVQQIQDLDWILLENFFICLQWPHHWNPVAILCNRQSLILSRCYSPLLSSSNVSSPIQGLDSKKMSFKPSLLPMINQVLTSTIFEEGKLFKLIAAHSVQQIVRWFTLCHVSFYPFYNTIS